ncbi:MAG: glycosyl hydrolase family 18 protein [Bacillota bacterium]|nr:glycosyl hydrolase family 18 protein [Bacillota bacterium]
MKIKKVIIAAVALIVILVGIIFFITNRSSEMDGGFYLDGEKILVDDYVLVEEDSYFINYDLLSELNLIDSFNDKDSKYIQIFHENSLYEINYNLESNTYIEENEKIYINSNYLKSKTIYDIEIYENGEYIFADSAHNSGKTIDASKIREDKYITSGIIKKIENNQEVKIYELYSQWALVRFGNNVGYVMLEDLESISNEIVKTVNSIKTNENKIVAWDMFNRKVETIANYVYYSGLDVIAPTWHSLDEEEFFTDWYLEEYYNYYKNRNVDVWGVFNNSFDRDLTSYYLRDRVRRKQTVEKIIEISEKYNYDGINLDFENLHYEDRDYLTAFIKELYIEARKHNFVFSVDITAVSKSQNWSLIYDREEIGKYSDYLALMAYDATTSPEQGIGPIASLPWVENAVIELKELTQSNNIILGVPFYTRLWEIIEGEDGIYYDTTALRVKSAQSFIEENEIPVIFDIEAKQNYGEKKIEDTTYKMWIEDDLSLGYRIDLVNKYNLKGIAIWALDYSTDELWEKIHEKN